MGSNQGLFSILLPGGVLSVQPRRCVRKELFNHKAVGRTTHLLLDLNLQQTCGLLSYLIPAPVTAMMRFDDRSASMSLSRLLKSGRTFRGPSDMASLAGIGDGSDSLPELEHGLCFRFGMAQTNELNLFR